MYILFLIFYVQIQISFNKKILNKEGDILYGAYKEIPNTDKLKFLMGANTNTAEDNWDTQKITKLAYKAGLKTQRKEFSEEILLKKGYDSEIQNLNYASNLGQIDLIGFITTPSKNHSSHQTDNKRYPPNNLYTDIFIIEDNIKKINPQNFWANHVFQTVNKYQHYIKIWEIWNEPDFTRNLNYLKNWENRPPLKNELINWHGTIYQFIRLLRISYEVIKFIDKDAFVSIGGISHPEFFKWILNKTDEPEEGQITKEYPYLGGAYFDCVSFHEYPHENITDIQTKEILYKIGSDSLVNKFITSKKNFEYYLNTFEFNGIKYPKKLFVSSATGVASVSIDDLVGDEITRQNFLLKLPFYCMENDIRQVHFESVVDKNLHNIFSKMGDYDNVPSQTLDNANMKNSTKARLTLGKINIEKMRFEKKKTEELRKKIPNYVYGIVLSAYFVRENEEEFYNYVYALWLKCEDGEISSTKSVSFELDYNTTMINYLGNENSIGKKIQVSLTGTPIFFAKGNLIKNNFINLFLFLLILL